jgi:RNA polymerase sigma factor (sigma-70 family)
MSSGRGHNQGDFRDYYEQFRSKAPLSAKEERRLLRVIKRLPPTKEDIINDEVDDFLDQVELGISLDCAADALAADLLPGNEEEDIAGMLDQLLGPTVGEVKDAWKKFIMHNMRLVLSRVLRFRPQSDPNSMELVSYGTDGLLRAIDLFDLGRNVRFSTYAVHWIDSFIRKGLEFLDGQRAPAAKQLNRDFKKGEKALTERDGMRPTNEDVAEHIGWGTSTLVAYQSSSITNIPIEVYDACDEKACPIPSTVSNTEVFKALRGAMKVLDPHEEEIIRRHYGLGYPEETLQSLADMFHVTKERIRQIENDGLKKLYLELRRHRPLDA